MNVLIIDDDSGLRQSLSETIVDLGHQATTAMSGREGLTRLRACNIDAVLLDLRMAGELDGLSTLARIRASDSPPPVAILTAYATAEHTIEAMRLGAFDHLTKPIGRNDLKDLLARMLLARSSAVRGPIEDGATTDAGGTTLIGSSMAIREVQKLIGLAADSDALVLIRGETGTGKELVARALHDHGRRSKHPFIAVNCAAIPSDLLESELFGHVKGAFTGAGADRLGAFREADRGTLFLDEIGDMPVAMQAKILRVLQDNVVTPVGGRSAVVDVRIVAATHCNLQDMVAKGTFREDLYYRLNVVPITLPPLRERLSDIVPLAEYFLRLAASPGVPPKRLTAALASHLLAYSWPGNVRELKNAIERAVVMVRGETLGADAFDLSHETHETLDANAWLSGDLPGAVARLEAEMIRRALVASEGNRTLAARRLNINRQLLYTKMQRYGFADDNASEIPTSPVGKADS
jgi:two-component system NtrC family response regulator